MNAAPRHWETEFVFGARYPERAAIYETIARLSEEARGALPIHRDLVFGTHPRERLNLFPAGGDAPLLVFFHGGYWRSQDRRSYDFVAPAFHARGFSVAVPGYPLAPHSSLDDIVASARSAVDWLRAHAHVYGAAGGEVYLCGHSAGGYLAAAVASARTPGAGGAAIAGCLAVSGIFDLRPLLETSINADIGLDRAQAVRLSPLQADPGPGWLVAAYGEEETAAFQEQALAYADHWRHGGGAAQVLPIAKRNHYDILLDLASSGSRVAEALSQKVASVG